MSSTLTPAYDICPQRRGGGETKQVMRSARTDGATANSRAACNVLAPIVSPRRRRERSSTDRSRRSKPAGPRSATKPALQRARSTADARHAIVEPVRVLRLPRSRPGSSTCRSRTESRHGRSAVACTLYRISRALSSFDDGALSSHMSRERARSADAAASGTRIQHRAPNPNATPTEHALSTHRGTSFACPGTSGAALESTRTDPCGCDGVAEGGTASRSAAVTPSSSPSVQPRCAPSPWHVPQRVSGGRR